VATLSRRSKVPGSPSEASKGKEPQSPWPSLVMGLVTAVVSGVGGVAFVSAVGGLVAAASFRGAGLPSEFSVAVQSKGQLLASGTKVLGLVFLFGLIVVAVVHWSDQRPWKQEGPADSRAAQDHVGPAQRRRWLLAFFLFLELGAFLDYRLQLAQGFHLIRDRQPSAIVLIGSLVGSAAATVLAAHAIARRDAGDRRGEVQRLVGLFGVICVVAAMIATAGSYAAPRVRAAAVLLQSPHQIVCGLYVGQTSDRLYIGETVVDPATGRGAHSRGSVLEFDRARVQQLMIGSNQTLVGALETADDLALVLNEPCDLDPAAYAKLMAATSK